MMGVPLDKSILAGFLGLLSAVDVGLDHFDAVNACNIFNFCDLDHVGHRALDVVYYNNLRSRF